MLKRGSKGTDVENWQAFLVKQGLLQEEPDGDFGPKTDQATRAFQKEQGLEVDGKVGPDTMKVARKLGFGEPESAEPPGTGAGATGLVPGTVVTEGQLKQMMGTLPAAKRTLYLGPLNEAMKEFSITTPHRIAAFLAQTAHESGEFKTFVENMNYSAERLAKVFPHYFPTVESAEPYAHKPEKIGSRVYGNRLGNGDEASGEGYRFRGRGCIQVTGKENYQRCGKALGVDLVAQPELLETPEYAFRSAGWFWSARSLNDLADQLVHVGKEDEAFRQLTKKINGGTAGLDARRAHYAAAKAALGL